MTATPHLAPWAEVDRLRDEVGALSRRVSTLEHENAELRRLLDERAA